MEVDAVAVLGVDEKRCHEPEKDNLKNVSGPEDQGGNVSSKPTRRRWEEAFDKDQENEEEDDDFPVVYSKDAIDGQLKNVNTVNSDVQELSVAVERIPCQLPSCTMFFSSTKEYQKHYNSRHMHACGVCRKSLPSSHILELHVLELHDTLFSLMAERKPMYQCFLETCLEKFVDPEERKAHCMSVHNFPEKFRFWQTASSDSLSSSGNRERKPRQNNSIEDKSEAVAGANQLPDIVPESDSSTKQKRTINGKGSSDASKPKPIHIAFGHTPHQMFKKNYAFGLQKSRKPGTLGIAKSATKEDGMDLSEIQEALNTSSTSALVLGLVDPKP